MHQMIIDTCAFQPYEPFAGGNHGSPFCFLFYIGRVYSLSSPFNEGRVRVPCTLGRD